MDLDKLSEIWTGSSAARELAERRRDGVIAPAHLLSVMIANGGSLAPLLSVPGFDASALAASFEQLLSRPGTPRLPEGKRPVADPALRQLIERSFAEMTARGAETAESIDCALAVIDYGPADLQAAMKAAGIARDALLKKAQTRDNTSSAMGEPSGGAGSVLGKYGRDLTAMARAGEIPPIVGRDYEVRRVIQTILRKTKNNPVLVGDPGTGKTAVAEALALRLAAGDVPESLKACRLVSLDLTSMVAGAKYRGEFEERIKGVVDEVRASRGQIILFLDELHTLVGAGGSEGGMDAANILKPALARGELRCVGATTFDEYRERIEKDGALARRFEVIKVEEPTDEAMLLILRGIRPHYEAWHGVKLGDSALEAAVKLSRRYIRSRFLPDKAIDVIDEATARIRAQKESKPDAIDKLERRLVELHGASGAAVEAEAAAAEKELAELKTRWTAQKTAGDALQATRTAIEEQKRKLALAETEGNVAAAAEIRYGALKYLEQQYQDQEAAFTQAMQGGPLIPEEVNSEHIAAVIGERVGIPITRMLESERERLLQLEERLGDRVYGQEEAVGAVSEAVRRMRTDLQVDRKPNSFLFVGPTGVGKTEMAKALAECLFDDDGALIRIDMGEYKDKSSVSSLIGSRPGLVGSDEGGFLTEKVRRSPYSIVLFDEVEKAHPEVLDILLGVLDEGRLSDAKGRFCDFSNTIVLFTSNLGVREAMAATDDIEKQRELILDTVKASMRPEFINRLSQIILFRSLAMTELERIVTAQCNRLGRKLKDDRDIDFSVTPEAISHLATESYDPAYGARPVGRTMQQLVLSPLATAILANQVQPGHSLRIGYVPETGLQFEVDPALAATP